MPKIITLNCLLLCGSFCFAQISNTTLDSIIHQSHISAELNELVTAAEAWPKYDDSYSKHALQVVYDVLLAESYILKTDRVNEKSTSYYTGALALSQTLNNPHLTIWVETQFGFYYYRFVEYINAVPYFFRVSQQLQNIKDPLLLIQPTEIYKKSAYFFGTVGDGPYWVNALPGTECRQETGVWCGSRPVLYADFPPVPPRYLLRNTRRCH